MAFAWALIWPLVILGPTFPSTKMVHVFAQIHASGRPVSTLSGVSASSVSLFLPGRAFAEARRRHRRTAEGSAS
jgi:hypothetical protein